MVCRTGAKTRGILNRSRRTLIIWEVSKRKKGVLESACFLHRSCCFLTFLVGILFLEHDLQGFRVHFVACSIRWFVWEVSNRKKGVWKSACFFTSFLVFLTYLVGILFLEPDLRGFRDYFVAFSIRWFVW